MSVSRTTVALRILIVDPDDRARAHLRQALEKFDFECEVEEAASGHVAIERIRQGNLDLVLLEVMLPDVDGFEVVGTLGPATMPSFAFTADSETYAVRAVGVRAVGYLIKPVSPRELAGVVDYVAHARPKQKLPLSEMQIGALRELLLAAEGRSYASCLAVRRRGRTLFVSTDDIDWIEADNTRVRLHTAGESFELRERLTDLEERLSPREFVRVHRGAIVRIDRIREIRPWFRGDYVIILEGGTKITTGHSYRDAVRALLRHR